MTIFKSGSGSPASKRHRLLVGTPSSSSRIGWPTVLAAHAFRSTMRYIRWRTRLGFDARRIAGSNIVEGFDTDANHGSVLINLEGVDYLVDAQFAAFKALPLVPGQAASTGKGIHDIEAVPDEDGFHVLWYAGHNREQPIRFNLTPKYDPVDHAIFLTLYERSTSNSRSPFNESLYISRHFSDSILTVGRNNKISVSSDNNVTTTELTDEERQKVLIEDFGISEETVNALPPDVPGGIAF